MEQISINDIDKSLKSESKARQEILDNALKDMATYSEKIIQQEEIVQQSRLEEIKYRTTIKELNGYIEIYKNKIDELEKENGKLEKEVSTLRKKVLKQETTLSSLQSILDLFIRQYGLEQISSITKIEEEQLKKLISYGKSE